MNETITKLMSHRSIRKFRNETVNDDVVEKIISAAFAASTSSNIQAATVIRVRKQKTREEIAHLAGNQKYVNESPVFLVWCADLFRSARLCELAGGKFEAGMTEHLVIATIDTALAAQNAAIAAESMGLGICYIGGIRNDPVKMTSLLQLPEQVFPVFGMCIGVAEDIPAKKPRLPLQITLKEETYTTDADEAYLLEYDMMMREYYNKRGANGRSWIEDMSKLLGKESRAHIRSFLDSQGLGTR